MQLGHDSDGGSARRAPGHEITHFTLRQCGDRQHESVANDLVHQRRALGRAAHLCVAVRADDQNVGVVQYPGDELQHLQRRRVGLVQVIEDDDDRMLARRFLEQRGDGVEEPKARLLGVDVRLGLGDLRRPFGQDPGDLRREVARAHTPERPTRRRLRG